MGYSLWGHKESDTTERLSPHRTHTHHGLPGDITLPGGRAKASSTAWEVRLVLPVSRLGAQLLGQTTTWIFWCCDVMVDVINIYNQLTLSKADYPP